MISSILKTAALAGAIAIAAAVNAASDSAPTGSSSPKPVGMTAAECEVWNRELSFAKSVETHDAVAFAEHVHSGAVFNAGSAAPVRGRAAIVNEWADIVAGGGINLRWHPGFVAIGDDPNIALSAGSAWIENLDPAATRRYTISRFTSTWVKDTDGRWRVLFDGSAASPNAASATQVAALAAKQLATCPRG